MSVPRFLRQVIRYGAPPVWGLVGSVLGIGILGVVTLARKVDPLWVALAAVGFIGAVFVVGAYRAWRDAERFRPSWELAQHPGRHRSHLASRHGGRQSAPQRASSGTS